MSGPLVAQRFAIKLNPPTVYLEYSNVDGQIRRVRAVKLNSVKSKSSITDLQNLTNKVLKGFPKGLDQESVNKQQLTGLLAQLLLGLQEQQTQGAANFVQASASAVGVCSGFRSNCNAAPRFQNHEPHQGCENSKRTQQTALPAAVAARISSTVKTAVLDGATADLSIQTASSALSNSSQLQEEHWQYYWQLQQLHHLPLQGYCSYCSSDPDTPVGNCKQLHSSSGAWQQAVAQQPCTSSAAKDTEPAYAIAQLVVVDGSPRSTVTSQKQTDWHMNDELCWAAAAPSTLVHTDSSGQKRIHNTGCQPLGKADWAPAGVNNGPATTLSVRTVADVAQVESGDESDGCLTLEADFLAAEDVDLNRATDYELRLAKAEMDKEFKKNSISPGQPGYVYDKQVDFDPAAEFGANDWDEE